MNTTAIDIGSKVPRNDTWLRGGLLAVVVAYLLVALVLPLFFVVGKSLQNYHFVADKISISMDKGAGFESPLSLQDYLDKTGQKINNGVRASEFSSQNLIRLIPKKDRRGALAYKLIDQSEEGGALSTGDWLSRPQESRVVAASDLKQIQVRPVVRYDSGNYRYYFANKSLRYAIFNSVWVALVVVAIVLPLAFMFAYAISRTTMRWRQGFRLVAMIPVLAPSLLPAIGLIYLFGKQGILKFLTFGGDIYGAGGIIIASVFFTLPHALLIIMVALSAADQRLYDAADVLGAGAWRRFFSVTLPGAKYGLISAGFVVFTLVMTDFGVPKVIGGNFDMLALDIYKQVVGQQNFQIGAVVSMLLLIPAVVAFVVDRWISRRQQAMFSASAQPVIIHKHKWRDELFFAGCSLVSIFIVGVVVICQIAALIEFWPYNLNFSLKHYQFENYDGGGWGAFANSVQLAVLVATIATFAVFMAAYLVEKGSGAQKLRNTVKLLGMLPMAVPGMVLGLAYIFFFNNPHNPLNFLYGTMAILVINTSIHLYTVTYLTATTSLKQLDTEFEAVTTSLRQPFWASLFSVTLPMSLPTLAEMWLYIFVNAMTTVSAVVFLYSPQTMLASVAVLNMDDAGDTAPAAAMALMIFYTNVLMRILVSLLIGGIHRRQRWRQPNVSI